MNTLFAPTFILLFFAVIVPANAGTWEQRFPTGTPPAARRFHTAVWTGSEMIVWGGVTSDGRVLNDGGRYNPVDNSWTAMTTTGAPSARGLHTAVWTGSEMIVWGGWPAGGSTNTGGRYNPATNRWMAVTTTGAPGARWRHGAVWTGSEMIIWGGNGDADDGGRYHPATNSWTAMSTTGAHSRRNDDPMAVWTGSEMIVWGGSYYSGGISYYPNDGRRYDPATNTWTSIASIGAPAGRAQGHSIWTGSEMIIWGGSYYSGGISYYFNTGGGYDPATNSWRAITTTGAPRGRYYHTALWTGREMIVWGGLTGREVNSVTNDGGHYKPATNSWRAVSTTGAPTARYHHTAVWTGSEMIVFGGGGGGSGSVYFNDTFSYTPDSTDFSITSAVLEGGNLVVSFPSEAGRSYTIWQSESLADRTWTDTGLPAMPGTGAVLTFSVPAPAPGPRFFRVKSEP